MDDLISRQAAIRIVDGIDTWQAGWRGDAIESMKALPTAQPETHEERTETHACDLISRQAVIEINQSYHGQMPNEVNHRIWEEINALPSAQPEIIRCKDCVYWVAHDKRCVYLNHGFYPNMWCCHGRRADG